MYAGRKPLTDYELVSLARRRKSQLEAALSAARKHDEERAEIERQIREIDEAIARGSDHLTEHYRNRLLEQAKLLR